tara:strand:+ start:7741 stop:9117 length:1377 start_codon:yes stop_codon:yes gene_type:complete
MTLAKAHIKRMIVGLGVSGQATARYCQRMGWAFDLCDSRDALPAVDSLKAQFPKANIRLGALDGELLADYHQIIVSPGVALSEPALQQALSEQVEVIGDVELFARHNHTPVIAITGSNGKSTVTTLVRDILVDAGMTAVMGGNIGVPVLDLLDGPQPDVYVLELSSFQLETTSSLKARVATILNLSEDHLDRYQGMADYGLAKQRIFIGCELAVVNRDDDASSPHDEIAEEAGFTLNAPADDDFGLQPGERDGIAGDWVVRAGMKLVHSSELKIRGRHNLANVMAALALVETVGVSPAQARTTLCRFAGLAHRCEWVGEHDGVAFINDSKGTNVGSTLAAIQGLAGQGLAGEAGSIWLLAGGDGKGQDFQPLTDACQTGIAGVCCFGKDGGSLATALAATCPAYHFPDLFEAFTFAARNASAGDIVLLSPACASLDQFPNYMERGRRFCELVGRLVDV